MCPRFLTMEEDRCLRWTLGMTKTILILTAVATGLMAGLFAAFSYAVMPGLRKTDDAAFVSAMRGINKAILNPVFGVIFGGALVLLVGCLVAFRQNAEVRPLVIVALVLYLSTLVVTMGFNVPLNNRLQAGAAPVEVLREAFEGRWVAWNTVRAALNTGAFAAIALALTRL